MKLSICLKMKLSRRRAFSINYSNFSYTYQKEYKNLVSERKIVRLLLIILWCEYPFLLFVLNLTNSIEVNRKWTSFLDPAFPLLYKVAINIRRKREKFKIPPLNDSNTLFYPDDTSKSIEWVYINYNLWNRKSIYRKYESNTILNPGRWFHTN